ncbi:extracellular solute-binding protein [Streptomyces sp. NBC_00356]|uniref:extracellular solute-binding protein n=1 Tax=Streptomyces sp. NBC_00356 TaxID=2975724 RepID=UPI002E2689A5
MTVPNALPRRTFMGAALAGAGALTGCSTVTRSTDVTAINKPVELPEHRRWQGVKPDLPTTHPLMPETYLHYPSNAKRAFDRPPGRGLSVQGHVPTNSPVPPSLERNRYWLELNKRTGVRLNLAITPGGDYDNKFQTSVAGDALGDVWNIVNNPAYLPQLLEAKAHDLTPHLSGSAIHKYPFLANLPTQNWQGCVFSGRIFAVPITRGAFAVVTLLSRADLFRKRDVDPEFHDVSELLSMGKEMTDDRRNHWAFASAPIQTLATMLGLSGEWSERGGRFTFFRETEEYHEALDIARRMTTQKMVHPDGVTAFNGKVWFRQGTVAMLQDTYSALPGLYQQGRGGFEVALPVIPGPDGKPGRMWLTSPNNSITALSRAEPGRIEAILEYLNWCAAPIGTQEYTFRKYGIEGYDFNFEKGDPVLTDRGNSETGLGDFPIQYLADSPKALFFPGFPEATEAAYRNLRTAAPHMKLSPTYGLYSPTSTTKGQLLTKLLDDSVNNILLGRAKVSSWPETIRQWRRRGGDAMRAEYEQALATRKS